MYLQDAGIAPKVTSVSSVSGGSITNGYLAQQIDFDSATDEEFS